MTIKTVNEVTNFLSKIYFFNSFLWTTKGQVFTDNYYTKHRYG